MKALLAQLLEQLAREPGTEAFQGITISPGGRCQAIYRWNTLNFRNLSELEAYYELRKRPRPADGSGEIPSPG